ncbi:MAG TPA: hypothetical protein VFQ61_08790 [Polyangiaceae bacterium]|nr:hypothetical protein [Polyangiaceae bacterium]
MNTLLRSLALGLLTLIPACNTSPEDSRSDYSDRGELRQAQIVAECRNTTKDCLKGAVTVTDIRACREVFTACAGDAIDLVDSGLAEAIDLAEHAVDITVDQATGLLGDVGGLTSHALNAVDECRAGVTQCLSGVVSVSDISKCQEVFDACVGGAMSVAGVGIQIDLPGSSKTGCSVGVSACLGSGKPPAQCAIGAQLCLSH